MIGILISIILIIISIIHIYWAFGGKWGIAGAIPTHEGKPLFEPEPIGTLVVSLGLIFASSIILGRVGYITLNTRFDFIFEWGIWFLAIVFLLRAIGDFKYVGLFKKIKDTNFAYWDTRLHSPLCFIISIGLFYLALN